MTNARWSIAAVLIALIFLTGINFAAAQVGVKAEDLIGTWELVSAKDLKTGADVPGMDGASTALQWMQLTRSHWMIIAVDRSRSVVSGADFAKLSPEEKVKTNYARVWNEKNEQVFAARGGTYRLDGDKLHHTVTMSLYTSIIGVDRVLKIVHLDTSTLIAQTEYPDNPALSRELTFRRLD
jgi:hypothetical protein